MTAAAPRRRSSKRTAKANKGAVRSDRTVTDLTVVELEPTRLRAVGRIAPELELPPLRASSLLPVVFGTMPHALIVVDREGQVVRWNTKATRLFGWRRRDVLGRSIPFLIDDEDESAREHWVLATRGRRYQGLELRVRRRDDRLVTIELHASPILDNAGVHAGTVLVAVDVTALRRVRSQLEATDRMASVGMLTSAITQELATPLTNALANLDFALKSLAEAEASLPPSAFATIRDALEEALASAQQVDRITMDVRMLAQQTAAAPGHTDIVKAIDSALNLARLTLRERARLVRRYDQVPLVASDEGKLSRLFVNLVVYAVESIPPGRPGENTISVGVENTDHGTVRVRITDTGLGMSDEQLELLAEPAGSPKAASLALGLFLARRIAHSLGATLRFDSIEGEGTTCTVELPVAAPTPSDWALREV
jgi:two-component system NtrC family sensor kinase